MSLTSVFNRGLDGLTVAQRGLATASNNVANVNTKGYARQDILVSARASVPGATFSGGGAEIAGLRSIVEPFVEMQLFETGNSFGTVDGRKKTVAQLETVWNESQNTGLGRSINDFFNSFSELANQPTSIPLRQAVRDRGILLSQNFNRLSTQMYSMKRDLSNEIDARVTSINSKLEELAGMNESIVNNGGTDKSPELVASRLYLLRQISEELKISYYENDNGSVEVQLPSGGSLVSGFSAGTLSVASNDLSAGGLLAINLTTPIAGAVFAVTDQITTGRLGGNLSDRNTTINDQMANLDTLAYQMATQFNTQYSAGYGLAGSTGNNFFGALVSSTDAASSIQVDASVTADVRTIAVAQQDPAVSGVSDNRNALTLANLQNSLTMSTGTATFAQYYQGLVGDIGNEAVRVNRDYETQSYLLNQIEVQRESISGVNMDEEGANIIRYQRAFQASSKMMSIADQLMDDLLRI